MTKNWFDDIPKLCINLPKSIDRKERVALQFKSVGIEAEFIRGFTPVSVGPKAERHGEKVGAGIIGCALSHVNAVKTAKERGYPKVVIFEDDVVFNPSFRQVIDYIGQHIGGFDVFCLGGHFPSKNDLGTPTMRKYISRVTDLGGTYAYILDEKCYDFILEKWNPNYGMDEFYGNFLYRNFESYAFVPFPVGTEANVSTITGKHWEYENVGWFYSNKPIFDPLKNM